MKETEVSAEILAACQRGDREAFHLLFETYKDRVYTIAFHYSNDENLAKDTTQQVFIKLFDQIKKFRGDAQFSTWLYRIVINICLDEQRKTRRFVPIATPENESITAVPGQQEEGYQRKQIAQQVRKALMKLPPQIRAALLLKYFEGLSYQEIAQATNSSPGTIASRLNRGHKALAHLLAHLRSAFNSEKK
jgi:RNA polymerase sigma-70 factor, ECF subfamily